MELNSHGPFDGFGFQRYVVLSVNVESDFNVSIIRHNKL